MPPRRRQDWAHDRSEVEAPAASGPVDHLLPRLPDDPPGADRLRAHAPVDVHLHVGEDPIGLDLRIALETGTSPVGRRCVATRSRDRTRHRSRIGAQHPPSSARAASALPSRLEQLGARFFQARLQREDARSHALECSATCPGRAPTRPVEPTGLDPIPGCALRVLEVGLLDSHAASLHTPRTRVVQVTVSPSGVTPPGPKSVFLADPGAGGRGARHGGLVRCRSTAAIPPASHRSRGPAGWRRASPSIDQQSAGGSRAITKASSPGGDHAQARAGEPPRDAPGRGGAEISPRNSPFCGWSSAARRSSSAIRPRCSSSWRARDDGHDDEDGDRHEERRRPAGWDLGRSRSSEARRSASARRFDAAFMPTSGGAPTPPRTEPGSPSSSSIRSRRLYFAVRSLPRGRAGLDLSRCSSRRRGRRSSCPRSRRSGGSPSGRSRFARQLDRVKRLGERPDLVHLDEDRGRDALADPRASRSGFVTNRSSPTIWAPDPSSAVRAPTRPSRPGPPVLDRHDGKPSSSPASNATMSFEDRSAPSRWYAPSR